MEHKFFEQTEESMVNAESGVLAMTGIKEIIDGDDISDNEESEDDVESSVFDGDDFVVVDKKEDNEGEFFMYIFIIRLQ